MNIYLNIINLKYTLINETKICGILGYTAVEVLILFSVTKNKKSSSST